MNDAIIVGGGTAGSAAALALARAGHTVTVLDRQDEPRSRIGESLPPAIRKYLTRLGVWDVFQADGHRVCGGICSAWGTPQLMTTDHIMSPNGRGWIVDRQRFDRMLKMEAIRVGADYHAGTRAVSWHRASDGWSVTTGGRFAGSLRGRMLIDATGRSGLIARTEGAKRIVTDCLMARSCYLSPSYPVDDNRPLVETCRDGWWYSAGLPDGTFIAALFTSVGVSRRLPHDTAQGDNLKDAPLTRDRIGGMSRVSEYTNVAADSYRRDPPGGEDWHAVGDAAIGLDPLASTGIVWALHSALETAQLFGSETESHFHRDRISGEWKAIFEKYDEQHRFYMSIEKRWPESAFWRRYQ